MTADKLVALLPCPFCGSSDVRVFGDAENESIMGGFNGACGNPNCQATCRHSGDRDKAIRAWNTRALAQSAASGESLAQAIEHGAKGWERAAKVEAQASDLIGSLVALAKSLYLFGPPDVESAHFNGRPLETVMADLLAADSAAEMRAALDPPLAAGRDGVGG